jgi:hypothetical protein
MMHCNGLTKLAEECGELAAACCVNSGSIYLESHELVNVAIEMGDVTAAIQLVRKLWPKYDWSDLEPRRNGILAEGLIDPVFNGLFSLTAACSLLVQSCTKKMAFMDDEIHPSGVYMMDNISYSIAKVQACIAFVQNHYQGFDWSIVEKQRQAKIALYLDWHENGPFKDGRQPPNVGDRVLHFKGNVYQVSHRMDSFPYEMSKGESTSMMLDDLRIFVVSECDIKAGDPVVIYHTPEIHDFWIRTVNDFMEKITCYRFTIEE